MRQYIVSHGPLPLRSHIRSYDAVDPHAVSSLFNCGQSGPHHIYLWFARRPRSFKLARHAWLWLPDRSNGYRRKRRPDRGNLGRLTRVMDIQNEGCLAGSGNDVYDSFQCTPCSISQRGQPIVSRGPSPPHDHRLTSYDIVDRHVVNSLLSLRFVNFSPSLFFRPADSGSSIFSPSLFCVHGLV